MREDHIKTCESSNDEPWDDDDDLVDLTFIEDPDKSTAQADTVRPDIVDKVFRTLSADAQRGDGELQREDINRIYLRKQLSIAECMAVEEKLLATDYRILEDDETVPKDEGAELKQTYHYLNDTEEKALGRKIQLALRLPNDTDGLDPTYVARIRKDAEQARTTFVATNIRFVEQLARRLGEHRHLSFEDIKQEGLIGLLKAVDLYDPERGFRFKTYATWWIEQRMRRAIADGNRIIRLPVHVQEKISRIRRAKAKLTLTYGRPPAIDELAAAVGMEPEKLSKLLWHEQTTDCTDGDMPIGDDTTILSLVADPAESAFDLILYRELQQRLRDVLATLTPREENVVRLRFGIDLDHAHTLESIGQRYNLTRERIRQIEAKALRKLRHPSRKDKLSDFQDS